MEKTHINLVRYLKPQSKQGQATTWPNKIDKMKTTNPTEKRVQGSQKGCNV